MFISYIRATSRISIHGSSPQKRNDVNANRMAHGSDVLTLKVVVENHQASERTVIALSLP